MIGLIAIEDRPRQVVRFRPRDAEFNRLLDMAERLRGACEANARRLGRLRALDVGAIALTALAWNAAALALLGGADDAARVVEVVASLVVVPGGAAGLLTWRLRLRQRRRRRRIQLESAALHDVLAFLDRMKGRVAATEGWTGEERDQCDRRLAVYARTARTGRRGPWVLRGDGLPPATARSRRPKSGPPAAVAASFGEILRAANRAGGYAPFATG